MQQSKRTKSKNCLRILSLSTICLMSWSLLACDSKKDQDKDNASILQPKLETAEVLPYLNIQEAKADYALPFCEKKNCIEIDIQTIKTSVHDKNR